MKKAVLYARVSSDLQQKERTVESQVLELKKQIADAGNVLVHEYVDEGYSGARLDRPALDQMRRDLRSNVFDTISFLNTDRIARDVTYQTIIIAEILKYKKQIIINGRDYVHNPENKFSLTVLGAVAELERAKIIERMMRGKQHRLKQGCQPGQGHNIYGYDYIKKSHTEPAEYVINEREANVVRYIFEVYANGNIGLNQITRNLEEMNAPTKTGGKLWNVSRIKYMLKNVSYTGDRFYNRQHYVREHANPLHAISKTSSKLIQRPREEWVRISIPPIISKLLFNKVQKRFEWNQRHYRNPKRPQLLSNLIECGECGKFFFAYQRQYRDKRSKTPDKVHQKYAYKCSWRQQYAAHSPKSNVPRCYNKEIKSALIEAHVWRVVDEIMLDPAKLRSSIDFLVEKRQVSQQKLERKLRAIEKKIRQLNDQKKRTLDLYANGELSKSMYAQKSLACDNEIIKQEAEREEVLKLIPILHQDEVITASMSAYCHTASARFEECDDFESKRQFLLDHIQKIVYRNDEVRIYGAVPVQLKAYEDPDQPSDASQIPFCIESKITRQEMLEARTVRDRSGRSVRRKQLVKPI